ncbi:hypothetical protein FSARC_1048 [Fusarium sarcochroum]|uniref:CYTH domain-containing protein n=1 Tax=Fusarium sarcochroum TaxID=1208366 RepID=A0A8H4U9Z8_9HYPO|nr:hypothetical protein FSARC_1048 [Fusarium sarcochroum]
MKLYSLVAFALFGISSSIRTSDKEIHLQWSLCDRDAETVLKKLGEDVRDPYKRNPITYFDTMPPTHAQQGVMFRTKTNKGEPFSAIKVRFNEKPTHTPPGVECVYDRYGNNILYTCGEKFPLSDKPKKIWSDDQVRFAEKYDDIDWDGLVSFGPFPDGKWKLKILGHKAKLDDVVAGTLHLMEIELSTPKAGSDDVYWEVTEYLRERGVVLCDPQASKTLRLFHEMGYIDDDDDEEL